MTERDPENGQYVSLSTLFERERRDHSSDHDRERVVARETAQRLEREVEESAQRLEQQVQVALRAVSATAAIHADAHQREHVAHERIHSVEKDQVEAARATMEKRLDGMNEFRDALSDQSNRAVTRDYYDVRHEELKEKVNLMEKRMAYYAGAAAVIGVIGGIFAQGAIP